MDEQKQKFYDALVEFIILDPASKTTINEEGFWDWLNQNYEQKKIPEDKLKIVTAINVIMEKHPVGGDPDAYMYRWNALIPYLLTQL